MDIVSVKKLLHVKNLCHRLPHPFIGDSVDRYYSLLTGHVTVSNLVALATKVEAWIS